MAAFTSRAAWFGWAGGGFSAELGATAPAAAAVVGATYARALRASPAAAQFTATVNGTSRGITGVAVGGTGNKSLLVTLASALVAGDNVVVNYTPGATPAARLAYSDGSEFNAGTIAVKSA